MCGWTEKRRAKEISGHRSVCDCELGANSCSLFFLCFVIKPHVEMGPACCWFAPLPISARSYRICIPTTNEKGGRESAPPFFSPHAQKKSPHRIGSGLNSCCSCLLRGQLAPPFVVGRQQPMGWAAPWFSPRRPTRACPRPCRRACLFVCVKRVSTWDDVRVHTRRPC